MAAIIPGKWAIEGELEGENQPWVDARDKVFDDSRWSIWGVLYVHYGAQYGVSALKMVRDEDEKVTAAVIKKHLKSMIDEAYNADTSKIDNSREKMKRSTSC